MSSIWVGIAPGPTSTRVLAMHGASETILKARQRRAPAHPRALATLLDRGAAVDAQDGEGNSALHAAVRAGRLNVVRLLLGSGADAYLFTAGGDTAASLAERSRKQASGADAKKLWDDIIGALNTAAKQKPPTRRYGVFGSATRIVTDM